MDEILSHLAGHNCSDVTRDIDPSQCSQLAISTGGFGDVYRGRLFDGTRIALKCLRVLIGFNNEGQKQLKVRVTLHRRELLTGAYSAPHMNCMSGRGANTLMF